MPMNDANPKNGLRQGEYLVQCPFCGTKLFSEVIITPFTESFSKKCDTCGAIFGGTRIMASERVSLGKQ